MHNDKLEEYLKFQNDSIILKERRRRRIKERMKRSLTLVTIQGTTDQMM